MSGSGLSWLEEALPSCLRSSTCVSKWNEFPSLPAPVSKRFAFEKRAFDVVSSGLGLIALSPVMLAAAVAVKATSEGPVIFKQERYGKDNVPFTCYKFRSMKVDTPSDVPTSQMNENPNVMTPVGGFLRKTSIDELPQLFNIFKGDMSVIGPRPMILAERDQIEERERYGATDIKPGLTGWAQVNGRDNVNVEDKARLDGEYRKAMSPSFDAKIFLKSIEVVVTREGYSSGCKKPRGVGKSEREGWPKKILVVTQHYWPEPFNFADMCAGLVERGYEVTVLTGLPNYPEGEIYPGYEDGKNRKQFRDGVRIVRVPMVPRGSNPVQRVVNYYSFSHSACKKQKELGNDFDVVASFQSTPVMQTQPAIEIANRLDIPLLHYVIDIWPECLQAGGFGRGTVVYNHFAEVSRKIYEQADRLMVTSPQFNEYLVRLLGHEVSTGYLPQYAEDVFSGGDGNLPLPEGYSKDKINFTFAGNVGAAQSVGTLVTAAAILQDDDRFVFHVVGSGSELEHCKQLAERLGISNVVFHGKHDIGEMPAYYAASDAMIATFTDTPVLGFTLPRKIQSYMAAGRPVVAACTGEAKRVVEEAACGFCCEAQDPEALAIACMKFAYLDDGAKWQLGINGRNYYQRNFSREMFLNRFEEELKKLKELSKESEDVR